MIDAPGGHDESLPLAILERIDGVCLEFEAAWKRDEKPRIEHYLGATRGVERRELLRELLLLDVIYRRSRGETPTVADYQERFLKDSDLLPEILEQFSAVTQPETTPIRKEQPFPELKLPCDFGDYELLSLLGEGGMGVVYRARQSTPDRIVALKIIRPDRLATSVPGQRKKVIERFRAEAQAVARLEHHNILPIYDVGEIDGQPFFSMRYVEGSGLDEVLRDGPMPGLAAAALLEPVARAVHYAHSRDLVHRDIKPRNILIDTGGCPYVTDFGLAKSLAGSQDLTQTLEVLGTPAYMSPEQARGSAAVDCRTDVYSLGVTLYELLIGRPPFRAATPVETQRQVIESEPAPPRQLNAEVDRDLDTICLKCLEKDRERRYATAEALADELARYQAGQPIHARPITRAARLWRYCKRNRAAASLGATASLLLLILAVGGPIIAIGQAERATRIKKLLDANRTLLTRAEEGERDAKVEADKARVQRDKARAAEQRAERARREAAELAAAERRAKYIADMKRADYFWEMNDVAVVRALLDRYLPEPGEEDLRSFEWHYWWRRCHEELTVLPLGGEVQRIDVSPDGKFLAAALAGGTITLWDLETNRQQRTFGVDNTDCVALAFSHDGTILAAAGGRGLAMFWDVASGDETDKGGYPFSNNIPGCVAFDATCDKYAWTMSETLCVRDRRAPPGESGQSRAFKTGLSGLQVIGDGAIIRTAPTMGILSQGPSAVLATKTPAFKQWFATDERAPLPRERGGPVFSIAFSRDGAMLAAGGHGGTVKVWDLADGKEKQTLQSHEGIVWALAFSPDGKTLASGAADGRVILWDMESGERKMDLAAHTGGVYDLSISEANTLMSAGRDSTIKFWDLKTGQLRAIRKGHEAVVNSLAVYQEGRKVASGGADGTVRVWDVPTLDENVLLRIPSATMLGASFSPDGQRLACVVRNDPSDINRQMPKVAGMPPNITGKSFNILGMSVERLVIWDWRRREELAHVHLTISDDPPELAIFSPDGRRVAVRNSRYDLTWDESSSHRHLDGSWQGLSRSEAGLLGPGEFFPDGSTLATAGFIGGKIMLWNVAQRRGSEPPAPGIQAALDTQAKFCLFVAVSPDAKILAAAADQSIQLWDTGSCTLTTTLTGHTDFVRCIAFSRNGKTMASAASDGTVRLWDVRTASARATLRGHNGGVSWVAISPDDKTVASAGRDGTIRLWDLRSGEEKTTLRGHGGWVTSVAFSPDGRTLASTSEDGTVRLWRSASNEDGKSEP